MREAAEMLAYWSSMRQARLPQVLSDLPGKLPGTDCWEGSDAKVLAVWT